MGTLSIIIRITEREAFFPKLAKKKKKKTLVSNISETETNIWMMDVQKWDWVFHFNRLVMC